MNDLELPVRDAHGLTAENFRSVFPIALRGDRTIAAQGEMAAEALEKRVAETDHPRLYPRIDELPGDLLDILAYDFKVDWWDPNYSLEEKRRTLKSNWRVHKLLGTKAAVETALSAIYPETTVEEWFDYGGEPYHFRIHARLADAEYESGKHRRVLERVAWYKNLRSHMDKIWYELQPVSFFERPGELWFRDFRVWLHVNNYGAVFLDGGKPLDGSWLLEQGTGRLWLVGTNIRTAARLRHRLDPVMVRAFGGIGVQTRERVPLRLDMGIFWADNTGGFVHLRGRDPLDGSWLLDQRPGIPLFLDFGARTRARERDSLRMTASYMRVPHLTRIVTDLTNMWAGVFPFAPVAERMTGGVSGGVIPRFVFRELQRAALLRLAFAERLQTREQIRMPLPVVSARWGNGQAARLSRTDVQIGMRSEGRFGGMLTVKQGGRFDGGFTFNGEKQFNGTIKKEEL